MYKYLLYFFIKSSSSYFKSVLDIKNYNFCVLHLLFETKSWKALPLQFFTLRKLYITNNPKHLCCDYCFQRETTHSLWRKMKAHVCAMRLSLRPQQETPGQVLNSSLKIISRSKMIYRSWGINTFFQTVSLRVELPSWWR